jgi:hypothetical protein
MKMKENDNVHSLDVLGKKFDGSTSVDLYKQMLINMKGINRKNTPVYHISLD